MTVGIQTKAPVPPLVSRFDSVLVRGIVLALTVMGAAVLMAPMTQGPGLSTTWQQMIGLLLVVGTLIATGAGGILMWSLRQMMSKIETLTKTVDRLEKIINKDHIADERHQGEVSRLEANIKSGRDWCERMQVMLAEHEKYITEHEIRQAEWWKIRHAQDKRDAEIHKQLFARVEKLERP